MRSAAGTALRMRFQIEDERGSSVAKNTQNTTTFWGIMEVVVTRGISWPLRPGYAIFGKLSDEFAALSRKISKMSIQGICATERWPWIKLLPFQANVSITC